MPRTTRPRGGAAGTGRGFVPEEILFSLTDRCNLRCGHCDLSHGRMRLALGPALRFLDRAAAFGIDRVGFTGGEPFLARGHLVALVRRARRRHMVFDRIMTNGVWWSDPHEARNALAAVQRAGFDGTLCLSFDAFHGQPVRRVARFIRLAAALWNRGDIVTLAVVTGGRDRATARMIARLARTLGGRVERHGGRQSCIRTETLFIKILPVALSHAGGRGACRAPWGATWFRDDRCAGPGNVFFVMTDGSVKPCCGYANSRPALTIGDIRRDGPAAIMRRIRQNRLVSTVFATGLGVVRRRLERAGVSFPGKTDDHCLFCSHLLDAIPRPLLTSCLDKRT